MAHLQVVAKGCRLYSPALAQIQDLRCAVWRVDGGCQDCFGAALSGPLCRQRVPFMSVATKSEVEPIAAEALEAADPAEPRRSVRPLLELVPFVARYRADRKSTRLNSSHSQISYAV